MQFTHMEFMFLNVPSVLDLTSGTNFFQETSDTFFSTTNLPLLVRQPSCSHISLSHWRASQPMVFVVILRRFLAPCSSPLPANCHERPDAQGSASLRAALDSWGRCEGASPRAYVVNVGGGSGTQGPTFTKSSFSHFLNNFTHLLSL